LIRSPRAAIRPTTEHNMDTDPPAKPIPVAHPVSAPLDDAGYEYVDEGDDPRPYRPRRARRPPPLTTVVRVLLGLMAVGLTAVFVVAACLRPYGDDGEPLTMATHTQLGLAPCNMVVITGKPCPACGMTTSFALLMHGDLSASLRANWVGTLIAVFWLTLIPWGAVTVIRGRLWGVRNGELFLAGAVGTIVALMIGRWAVIMLT
jgi:Protein of unknown function (DUF2752)